MKKLFSYFLLTSLVLISINACSPAAAPGINAGDIMTSAVETAFVRLSLTPSTPLSTVTETDKPKEKSTKKAIYSPTPDSNIYPTSIPTMAPMKGAVKGNAKVRSQPTKNKANEIGGVLMGATVNVLARNDAATWLYIMYPDSPTGTAWVVISAINLEGEYGNLPILVNTSGLNGDPVLLPPFIFHITGTPVDPSAPPADWTKFGTVTQPANVRLGPSIGYLSMGVLNPGEKVTYRGRIADNLWVQIDYPSGPEGKGWILSSLAQANDGYGGLPIYNILGTPETPAPAGLNSTTTPLKTTQATKMPGATVTASPSVSKPVSAITTPTVGKPISVTGTPTVSTPVPMTTHSSSSNSFAAPGEITNQVNVRSGPAQKAIAYGLINPKENVVITGVSFNGFWYQIEYTSSPNGVGWISSKYVRVLGDLRNIPIFDDLGTQMPH